MRVYTTDNKEREMARRVRQAEKIKAKKEQS